MNKRRRRKSEKVFKILGIVFSLILILVTLLFVVKMLQMDILPIKFLIPIIIGILAVDAGLVFVFMKESIKTVLKIIGFVLVILISIFDLVAYKYMNRSTKFIDNITSTGIKTENYYVIVHNDSDISKLEDLNNKKVSYVKTVGNSHDAIEKLKGEVSIISSNVTDTGELITGVVNKNLEVILLSQSIYEMYKEDYKVDDKKLDEVVKIVYTVTLISREKEIAKDVDVTKDAFVVYISGIDTYGPINTVSRSDVNIVGVVNAKTHQVLLISIPRDYYVKLHGIETDMRDKLTHAGMYGIDTSVGTIEDLLDIDINYYVKVNFTSVESIVDVLGGIEVDSKYAFSIGGYTFKKGINKLNGRAALMFCRERKSFSGGDRARGQNQQAVISAVIKKMSSAEMLKRYDSILSALEDKFLTNMSAENISKLIKMQLNDMKSWGIKSISLDGYDSQNYSYSYPKSAGEGMNYVMEPNLDTIKRAQDLIKDIKGNLELDLTDENKTYKAYINENSSSKTSSSSSKSTSSSKTSSSSSIKSSSNSSSVSNQNVSSSSSVKSSSSSSNVFSVSSSSKTENSSSILSSSTSNTSVSKE